MESAATRLAQVEANITRMCKPARRETQDVTLIAVSKTHPAERIAPLLEAGHRVFGENRVQEAQDKWPQLRDRFGDAQLHLIGQLQSNKAEDAAKKAADASKKQANKSRFPKGKRMRSITVGLR